MAADPENRRRICEVKRNRVDWMVPYSDLWSHGGRASTSSRKAYCVARLAAEAMRTADEKFPRGSRCVSLYFKIAGSVMVASNREDADG